MRVLLMMAFRNLIQARRRTTLLSLAIGMVTLLLVMLLAISAGINDNLIRSATMLSAGHINVAGFFKPSTTSAAPIVTEYQKVREIVEKNTPNLDYIIDRHRSWAKIISESGSIQAGLSGLVVSQESRMLSTLKLAKESDYKEGGKDEILGDAKRLSERGSVLLFASQAKRLGVTVGDKVTVRTETMAGRTNTIDLTVVAVAEDVGLLSSWSCFLPREDVLELNRLNDDTTGALWVYLKDIDEAPQTMAHLREVFAKEGYKLMDYQPAPFFFKFETVAGEDWTGQKLDLTIWSDEVSFITWVLTAFNTVVWFLVLILVAIIAVGIMNTMWNAVRERTKEIGTVRAIGMQREQVLQLFMFEALMLGFFATSVGAGTGALLSVVIDAANIPVPIQAMETILLSDTVHMVVQPMTLVLSIVLLTLFTSLAALWPSIRASLLSPVKALAHAE